MTLCLYYYEIHNSHNYQICIYEWINHMTKYLVSTYNKVKLGNKFTNYYDIIDLLSCYCP